MKGDGLPECKRCGWCCMVYELGYEQADIDRWFDEEDPIGEDSIVVRSNLGTYPVFDFVEFEDEGDLGGTWGDLCGDLWFHPETGEIIEGRCPFLRKVPRMKMYRCMVYEIRPEICRQYPGRCPESAYGAMRDLNRFEGIAGVGVLRRHFNKLQEKEQCERKNGTG
ncbi:MAG: YkgJ family cysteine cluster protein [Candidatus Thermoplasmatota archaeon]|nr:YkgJ family cysteine cluster protein [Candidatus Thermoplasmatota archaeon]